MGSTLEYPPIKLIQVSEASRNCAWMFLLHAIYGVRLKGTDSILASRSWLPWYFAGVVLVLLHIFALQWVFDFFGYSQDILQDFNSIMWLGFCLAVLVFTEQVFRLSTPAERQALKYLCVGLFVMYGYDFLMYTEALILRRVNPDLWQARGVLVGFTAPLVAVSVVRSRRHTDHEPASPNVVFHSFILMASGIYLVYMAAVGYIINYLGGSWSGVIQITFLSVSAVAFLLLVTSVRVRNSVRVWLSKHFFSYRYDYRKEWLDFTSTLAQSSGSPASAVTQAMAKLCGSTSGLLWGGNDNGNYGLVDHWHMPVPPQEFELTPLGEWFQGRHWIIDINEWIKYPEIYGGLEISPSLLNVPGAWLIVPLMLDDRVQGILLLCREGLYRELNWEDRDLLKIAGRAAATHLALFQADKELVELRQFDGFNRLSAYVIHDLKNILAQQSLIVYNAPHCRDEPEFLDDVIETVNNSVTRMKKLMAQMRSGQRGKNKELVDIAELIKAAIANGVDLKPYPESTVRCEAPYVEADPDQLLAVFGHIIKNAQEATDAKGAVTIDIECDQGKVKVTVEDSGCGMSSDFLENRLFKPFDTTKGLTGMGIGAYESREYVRQLGGDIYVDSMLGRGSRFVIILPLHPSFTETDGVL